jgi:hypothetical protein
MLGPSSIGRSELGQQRGSGPASPEANQLKKLTAVVMQTAGWPVLKCGVFSDRRCDL